MEISELLGVNLKPMRASDNLWDFSRDGARHSQRSNADLFDTLNSGQLRKTLIADPSCFEATFWLGVALRNEGEVVDATAYAYRAIQLNPDDAPAHGSLASCFSILNQPAKAIASLERAVELDPSCSVYRHNLGNELEKVGLLNEAILSFREAIRLDPQLPYSYVSLGRILRGQGKPEEANQYFDTVLSFVLTDAKSQFELARSFYDEGIVDFAEQCLRRVVSLEPGFGEAQALLGTVLLQLGRFAEAGAVLERAIELQPNSPRPYIELVESRKTQEEHRQLLQQMTAMVQQAKLSAEDRRGLHYALGKAFDDLAEYEAAFRHFEEANRLMLSQLSGEPFDRKAHTALLNLMIERFSERFLDMRKGMGAPTEKPILIVGMIRSGTTLIEQIVSSHPDVAAGGELTYLIQHYEKVLAPPAGTTLPQVLMDFARGYLALLNSIGGSKLRVTDKMPNNYFLLGLIHTIFPNARIIHCRRNPADTCTSIYTTPFPRPLSYAHSPEAIVFYYKEYQRVMEHWRKVLPADRFLEVDYEKLVANPPLETQRMIKFCGLDWDDSCLHHYRNTGAIRTPSWWQARQPVYGTSKGRWRNYEPWLGAFREL